MSKTIAVIDGHPDPDPGRFVHAVAQAYASGAEQAGHAVERIALADLDIEMLRSPAAWKDSQAPSALKPAQAAIARADHLVFIYPLWLGAMPALLKGFLEQVSSGGFLIEQTEGGRWLQKLKGKSARVIVTMGMPAAAYRIYFGAHSLKSFERNILRFAGVSPVRDTIIGMVEGRSDANRKRVLARIEKLGVAAR